MNTTVDIRRVSTTALMPVGSITQVFNYVSATGASTAIQTYNGVSTWIYVLNGEASTALAQGDIVRQKASQDDRAVVTIQATASLNKQYVTGVADHAIPAGSYGWVLRKGKCQIKGDGSVTVPSPIVCDATAGRAKNYTAAPASITAGLAESLAVIGFALADDGAAGSLFPAELNLLP